MKSHSATILVRQPNSSANFRGNMDLPRIHAPGPPQIITPIKHSWNLQEGDLCDDSTEHISMNLINNKTKDNMERCTVIRGTMLHPSST